MRIAVPQYNVADDVMVVVQKLGPDRLRDYVRQCDNEGSSALHLAVANGEIKVPLPWISRDLLNLRSYLLTDWLNVENIHFF